MENLHELNYHEDIKLGRKRIRGRFVIPSGVRCSHAKTIERYFKMDPVGIITTKSISLQPKVGYKEPLYAKYGENSYMNAVGLENPGARAFRAELEKISIPEDKFLLVSIFGSDVDSFYQTASILADLADGFELNMSCPHAKGYGLQIGNDVELVKAITGKISKGFDIPVFAKLSATIPNVAAVAKAALENGAAGITMTNTVGPGLEYISGTPILSNVVGGISGEAIRPLGLKALYEIRGLVGNDPLIIGMGGIFNAAHVESYHQAGADFFGVGSALTNLNTEEAGAYFDSLQDELLHPQAQPYQLPPVTNMDYQECLIEKNERLTDSLHKITVSKWRDYEKNNDTAAKFYFLMIPGTGEKPFALFAHDARSFIIKNVGFFTNEITGLKEGDRLFIRGPYGREMPEYSGKTICFVAGGTGISPVYEIAKKYSLENNVKFFLGGKSAGDIFDLDRFQEIGEVNVATEDGSLGTAGFVSDILENYAFQQAEALLFINVGPKPMIERCYQVESTVTKESNIWVSIEYQTSCGVGICGKCATEQGLMSCVDGPFLKVADALQIKECRHQ